MKACLRMLKQIGWFIGLWCAGLLALALISLGLKGLMFLAGWHP